MTAPLGGPEPAVRRAAMLARGLSGGRLEGARLALGAGRALWCDGREVHVPWPAPAFLTAGLPACVALQASPTKAVAAAIAAGELTTRELAALQLVEAAAALGWVRDTWPGLEAAVIDATGGLRAETWHGVEAGELLARARARALRRGDLGVAPALGVLALRRRDRSRVRAWKRAERVGHLFGFGGIGVAGAEDDGHGDGAPPMPGPEQAEDRPRTGIPYPEWDHLAQRHRPDHVTVWERRRALRSVAPARPRPELEAWFTAPLDRRWRGRLEDGAEVDIDAAVDALLDAASGRPSEPRAYRDRLRVERDVTCAILIDASASLARDDLLAYEIDCADALIDAMDQAGERHAVFSFSSDTRHDVSIDVLQDFHDRAVAPGAARLRPQRYTRLGAALRHVTARLRDQPSGRRVMLVLSDGVPFDESYEGEYAYADVLKAVEEAERAGILLFFLGVGRQEDDHPLAEHLLRVPEPARLAPALGDVHARLAVA